MLSLFQSNNCCLYVLSSPETASFTINPFAVKAKAFIIELLNFVIPVLSLGLVTNQQIDLNLQVNHPRSPTAASANALIPAIILFIPNIGNPNLSLN